MNTNNKTKKKGVPANEKVTKKQPAKKVSAVERPNSKASKKKPIQYKTFEGHPLTSKEARFIDAYMAHGNQRQAVLDAGFTTKAPGQYAQQLLRNLYIAHEIEHRLDEEHKEKIASGQQVMEFFTKVMNGEIKDQFGLDAPLSERIKAGQEIAKRTVDIANKIAGVKSAEESQVTIKLDWSRKHE